MGANLSKTPLLAIVYGSFFSFAMLFIPYSQTYREALNGFTMPMMGNLMLVAFGLWSAVIAAILYSSVKVKGLTPIWFILTFTGIQWFLPYLQQLMFGQPTGKMTLPDTLFQVLVGFGSTVLLIVLCMLLYQTPENQVNGKYKVKTLGLVIRLIVLPFIFMVLYFITWYFLAWRNGAVREYYQPGASDNGFVAVMIDLLLYRANRVPFSLLLGLLYSAFSLPLLFILEGKRTLFISTTTMLFLSGAVLNLIPSAVVPGDVRLAELIQYSVLLLVYGVLSGIILYTSLQKQEVKSPAPPPAPAPQGGRTATRPATMRK